MITSNMPRLSTYLCSTPDETSPSPELIAGHLSFPFVILLERLDLMGF